MEHGNRIMVVRGIHIRVQKKYKHQILFGGVYGSTAIGRDTEYSDIEMMYVLGHGGSLRNRTFLYQDIPVEINFIPFDSIKEWFQNISLQLPKNVGKLANLQLLIGETKQKEEILELYNGLSHERISNFFKQYGSEIGYESYNKIRSLLYRANKQERDLFAFKMANEITFSLSLINRQLITRGDYLGIKETYKYHYLPKHFQQNMDQFLKSFDLDDSIKNGAMLLKCYEDFMQEMGLLTYQVQSLDEIDF